MAIAVLLVFSGLVGGLAKIGIAYLMLPLFLAMAVGIAFQSPAVIGSFLLYGWIVLPVMDVPAGAGLPRLPTMSIATAVIVGALAIRRLFDGSLGRLLRPSVTGYIGLFAIIFVLGYLGIYLHGKMGSMAVMTLAWQKLISCVSMFVCGLLCCRNRTDLSFILRIMPIWFLIFPLYLPLDVYLDFFRNLVAGTSAYSVGLAFGLLNSNTMGQGACLAGIVAAVVLIYSKSTTWDRFFYSALFMAAAGITLASASRQSMLALLVGLAVLIVRLRPWVGVFLLVVIFSTASAFMQRFGSAGESNLLLGRYADIGKAKEEWSTGSYAERWTEIELALPHLLDRPMIGYGFGGYALANDIPDVRSRSELNNGSYLNDLWNQGYFLVGEHNFPLALYLQTGLVGVSAFLLLVIGPYFWLRRQNKTLPPLERRKGYVDDVIIISLGAAIFVLQNISGGLALGSMSTLLFLVGATLGGLAGRRPKASVLHQSAGSSVVAAP